MNNIKAARKRIGLKQTDLSARLGLSQAGLSLWENGKAEPGQEGWIMLSEILNVSVDFLMGVTDKHRVSEPFNSNAVFTDDEIRMVEIYRSLSPQGRDYIFSQLNIAMQVYTKNASIPVACSEVG